MSPSIAIIGSPLDLSMCVEASQMKESQLIIKNRMPNVLIKWACQMVEHIPNAVEKSMTISLRLV